MNLSALTIFMMKSMYCEFIVIPCLYQLSRFRVCPGSKIHKHRYQRKFAKITVNSGIIVLLLQFYHFRLKCDFNFYDSENY